MRQPGARGCFRVAKSLNGTDATVTGYVTLRSPLAYLSFNFLPWDVRSLPHPLKAETMCPA